MYIATNQAEGVENLSGGGSLEVGDAWARRIVVDEVDGPSLEASSSARFVFASCGSDDPNAFFVDPFFNTRGKIPTTVIQWSKGAIFQPQQQCTFLLKKEETREFT